jgi:hypothetical protein
LAEDAIEKLLSLDGTIAQSQAKQKSRGRLIMKKLTIVAVNMRLSYLFGSLLVMASIGAGGPVHAAEFSCGNVTCLIAEINTANSNGEANTINLDPGTYTLKSIDNSTNGPSGLPIITSDITINGEDAATTIIERDPGSLPFRIFAVAVSGKLTLNGLALVGGAGVSLGGGILNEGNLTINRSTIESSGGGSDGGGIYNSGALNLTNSFVIRNLALRGGGIFNLGTAIITHSSIIENGGNGTEGGGIENFGTATIQNSAISTNRADGGGGILNVGTMTITNTTIADNSTGFLFGGGGINNPGTLKITNSTISGNKAFFQPVAGGGGGIRNLGILELQNTILALNTTDAALDPAPDCLGPITSLGNNLIGDLSNCDISLLPSDLIGDPRLGAFTDNETPGNGHFPLLETSRAIDRGNNEVCSTDPILATDQVGLPRVGVCDIGAIEFHKAILVSVDIRPKKDANRINPNSTKDINVAIFSVSGFDATTVNANTVRFGARGTEAAPVHIALRDVDGDGNRDMVLRFQIPGTGIMCGDNFASLTGQTSQGLAIIGSSPITTVKCKKPKVSRN